ncbi:MAG: alanine racemase [Spirochaetales bacterium]|jgi:alanine racemase|nr:alanine racemase [Spirochaetales bacterium]
MRVSRSIVHLDNFVSNIHRIRELTRGVPKVCLTVKADAYGHGAVEIARAAEEIDIDFLGVASASEGIEITTSGISTAILLLSLPLPEDLSEIAKHGLSTVTASRRHLELLEAAAKAEDAAIRVHLKIDTGMGRIGCRPEDAVELAGYAARLPHVRLEGICTHFPMADDRNSDFTAGQIALFDRCISDIRKAGFDPGIIHAANSAGFIGYPGAWYDMIRVGIAAYGYPQGSGKESVSGFKPVMEVRSKLVFMKKVPAGTPLSYGHTYSTRNSTMIGTVAAGYGDGYPRILSNRSEVLIRGKRYPVIGTICMDQFLVDLGTDSDAELYDEVILFGPGRGVPDAAELADFAGTISYEITCGISGRLRREFSRD